MDTKKIGAFLKQCRKEKNLTQEQLARGVWSICKNSFQMGNRDKYAGSQYAC